ncbi:hypothetical protein SAMN05444583_12633 [Rhodococcus maanshanensis]|uniref:Uncharacterized protein n=1 Tax=Rhodococcus maanshanensis TaxID=183556 RepID=A0A1H7WDC5_9NOCA|nr:hypothetical protein SAMN05444583_12633 [Rhodococcus maanshanensis]
MPILTFGFLLAGAARSEGWEIGYEESYVGDRGVWIFNAYAHHCECSVDLSMTITAAYASADTQKFRA